MSRNCILCNESIEEDFGKLNGTMVKIKDDSNKSQFVHICSGCQKQNNWLERAKVKSA